MRVGPDRETILSGLLARLRPGGLTWGDLVVSAGVERQLSDIASRVAHSARGRDGDGDLQDLLAHGGTSVLLAGDPGTGKTLAARVLAAEVGRDLWRIDSGSVVSRYVGETEKNLHRLFEAAAAGEAVLFMDEADALLGHRTGVKDGHDRYSNIEIGYLLQQVESYGGLVLFATNGQSGIDRAFLRRLTAIVHFPRPDAACRRELWRRALPGEALVPGGVDLDRLARLDLTGGEIRAIASRAVLAAAAAAGKVATDGIVAAAEQLAAAAPARTLAPPP